ncbi:MAG TPA: lysophospholipid acyltransferase family protein [candidate division Zixibacteria bacterium]
MIVKVLRGFRVEGKENVPEKGGAIIASNHKSYVDPPVVTAAISRELYFLAKRELFGNKVFGWFISSLNAVPISRDKIDRKGLKGAIEILNQGNLLLVFPEGTRSRKDDFLEPKLGVGKLALEAGVPIVPTLVSNTRHFLKNIFTGRKVTVNFGEPLNLNYLQGFTEDKQGYQKIANEVMSRIKNLRKKAN